MGSYDVMGNVVSCGGMRAQYDVGQASGGHRPISGSGADRALRMVCLVVQAMMTG